MANININNNGNAAVRTGGQRVAAPSSSSRAVHMDRGVSAPSVELSQNEVNWGGGGGEASYGANEVFYSPQYDNDNESYVEQAVSRDFGSMSQQSSPRHMAQPEVQNAAPRHMATQSITPDASGLGGAARPQQRQQPQPQQQSVQQPSAPADVSDLPAMSSRSTPYTEDSKSEIHEALADSGVDLISSRMSSRGLATAPIATSTMATRNTEEVAHQQIEGAIKDTFGHRDLDFRRTYEKVGETGRPSNELNNPYGYERKQREKARTKEPSRKRASASKKAEKKRAEENFKNTGVGYRVYGKLMSDNSLDFRDVGIGVQELEAVLNQNPDKLVNLITTQSGYPAEIIPMELSELVNFINNLVDIYVAVGKPPVTKGSDVQRRKLVILTSQQRGVFFHQGMAAIYNADMDGDDVEVSFDPEFAEIANDPMDYMVNIDGKVSLNMDFIPVSRIIDGYEEGKTAEDFVRDVIIREAIGSMRVRDGRILTPFVRSVIAFGDTELSDDADKKKKYADMIDKARDLAAKLSGRDNSNQIMAKLCRSVNDNMLKIKKQKVVASLSIDSIVSADTTLTPRTYHDEMIYKLVDGMVDGEMPNNFQRLRVMMSAYLGNAPGKNAPFRFTADVGKLMKMDPRLQLGDGTFVVHPGDDAEMKSFFESTCEYVASLRMQKEEKKDGRSMYYTQIMRENVIKEVGFPGDVTENGAPRYESYSDFLYEFYDSYKKNSAIINEANLVTLTDGMIAPNSNRTLVSPISVSGKNSEPTVADLAEPFHSIYGIYSIGKMFDKLTKSGVMGNHVDPYWAGNPRSTVRGKSAVEREFNHFGDEDKFWVTGKYINWSVRKFKNENRINVMKSDRRVRNLKDVTILDTSLMSDVDAQFYMLLALADKRTAAASKFNQQTYGLDDSGKRSRNAGESDVEMLATLLKELDSLNSDDTVSGRADQQLWIDDLVNVMIASGTEMFHHFGMDSPYGFLKSKWAQKMMEHAKNPNVLGGIHAAMVFDWRMERVMDLADKIPDPNENVDLWMDVTNNLQFAKDELASSSEVWHGIMRELDAEASPHEESVFHMLTNQKALMKSTPLKQEDGKVKFRKYVWSSVNQSSGEVTLDAMRFWRNPGNHADLRSVIEDLNLGWDVKRDVIADVVRYWEQDAYLKSYEVGYQLEVGNDATYSINGAAAKSAFKVHKDFEQAFNRWGKVSQDNLQDDVDSAADRHKRKKGNLMRTLARLDSHPEELIVIDDGMYADAILAIKTKTYPQTEKSSQHVWSNAIYTALVNQRVGGFFNDVWRTDDRLLGVQNVGSLSIADVIHVLANKDAKVTVYNDYGAYVTVDRDILLKNSLGRELGPDVENDIWQFLIQNPRIASVIRQHKACVAANEKGTGYIGASLGMKETLDCMSQRMAPNQVNRIKFLFRNDPGYGALISLMSPGYKKYDSELNRVVTIDSIPRNERARIIDIENYLAGLIYLHASVDGTASDVEARSILEELGVTEEKIIDVLTPNYNKYCESLGIPVLDDPDEIDADATEIYLNALSNMTRFIETARDKSSNVLLGRNIEINRPRRIGVDEVSVASYWDMTQELSGAKTYMSTRIEGMETYNFARWVSYITNRDGYADLSAVDGLGEIDESWNGMWTNISNSDGTPSVVTIGDDGSPMLTIDGQQYSLYDAKSMAGVDEIVAMVPKGYRVKDKTSDKFGNQLTSLTVYMDSKRFNGAETFNLKAKKSGIDNKNSIIKMDNKYLNDSETRLPVEFEDRLAYLRDVAEETFENAAQSGMEDSEAFAYGLYVAKTKLAEDMLSVNLDLGYDDLTLANYMCLADLMLIVGDDGKIYLRSLEMLFTAIKHRISASSDDMSSKEKRKAADAIVNDTSENGVGILQMDPIDAFDSIRPMSKSTATSAIRPETAVFGRNYDLLKQIEEYASENGYEPIEPGLAEVISRDSRQKSGIKEVVERVETVRNHNVVGFAGTTERDFVDAGMNELITWTIGPSNMIVIGTGEVSSDRVAEICDRAYDLGMTVLVSHEHRNEIPDDMISDAIVCSEYGDVLLPCFDMRLNGSESKPYNGGRFAIKQVPFSKYTVTVEDPINWFYLDDAEYIPTQYMVDNMHVIDGGSEIISSEDLFPNVYRNPAFNNSDIMIYFANAGEVATLVASGVKCTIDYGVVEGGRGFRQRVHDVNMAIKKYQDKWSEADADGMILEDCEPGDIVAWAMAGVIDRVTEEVNYVFSPIIPFPLHGATKNIPQNFSVEQISFSGGDNTLLSIDWKNTSSIENGFGKMFDSSGGANKGMVNFSNAIDSPNLLLRDGTNVTTYGYKASTNSRKIGTDRRIKTMISLMALARMHGYNFARVSDSFPRDPELKEVLLRHDVWNSGVSSAEWKQMFKDGDVLFSLDRDINSFLNHECRKILMDGGNPSDYLANVYEDLDGNEHNTHVMWEFKAMFEQGITYENALLKFLHSMDPSFCPNGINDYGTDYLFSLKQEDGGPAKGFEHGVLEMECPFPLDDGSVAYLKANVYIGQSFFGEDYSGFSRPNINGSSRFLDAMNVMSMEGEELDEETERFMYDWATSDIGRVARDGGSLGKA